jgi:branched-chain amino acid transport system substrate-binding protein
MELYLDCAETQPLKAEGEPIKVGLLNHEGDPAGSFPEYSAGVRAAVAFVNEELGGLGGDVSNGTAGRPIELLPCFSTINPTETTSCANQIASEGPFGVFVALNFFGQPIYDVFEAAGTPVYVGSAINVAEFISPHLLSTGPGGGCVGVNTGEVDFAVNNLGARNVVVVWSDTPPGVVCYNDTQKKALDVLAGEITPTPDGVEVVDGLVHSGVSFPPGAADLTGVAQQVLDAEPDVIIMTSAAQDDWNFVNALYALGYDPATGPPVVFDDTANDPELIEAAGDKAEGVYFVGSTNFADLAGYEGLHRREAEQYEVKVKQYEGDNAPIAGLGYVGFTSMMTLWQMWTDHASQQGGVDNITPESAREFVAATSDYHGFGGFPLGCADAVAPYVALCNSDVEIIQWKDGGYQAVVAPRSYIGLIAGTELDPAATAG